MKFPKLAFLVTLLAAIILVNAVLARPASDFSLWWRLIDGGGGSSLSGSYMVNGSLGQAAIGEIGSAGYRLAAGYWQRMAAPAPPPMYKISLPVILRAPP